MNEKIMNIEHRTPNIEHRMKDGGIVSRYGFRGLTVGARRAVPLHAPQRCKRRFPIGLKIVKIYVN